MRHSHLDAAACQLDEIGDITSRGLWQDWVDLRRAVIGNPCLHNWIERVCKAFVHDPIGDCSPFWSAGRRIRSCPPDLS